DGNRDLFLSALDYPALRQEISENGRVIVEGCAVLAALLKLELEPDFRIYVVRTVRMHAQPDMEWIDERDLLFGEKTADELIHEQEEQARRWAQAPSEFGGGGSGDLPNLVKELITYHCEFKPHRSADLIVKVVRRT